MPKDEEIKQYAHETKIDYIVDNSLNKNIGLQKSSLTKRLTYFLIL